MTFASFTTMDALRAEFPGLVDEVDGRPLCYLDSAATTQKHITVIERMDRFLRHEYGTVHRGMYRRSVQSTKMYEEAREVIARFLGAQTDEIIYTMGCTDAINLVAHSWGRHNLKPGDRVLITAMEHHANIVPWQLCAEATGCELIVCPMHQDGSLDLEAFHNLLDERVKFVSLIHVANSLGTINPVKELTAAAHKIGAKVLVDGAQSVPHMPVDVKDINCDFLSLSAHKCYGPTGIGALYGKAAVLADMPPWRGGGEMIERVTFEKTTYAPPPSRFEAGTPPIVEAIGFATACEYLMGLGMHKVAAREHELFTYAEDQVDAIEGIKRIGKAPSRGAVISFVIDGAHASDISQILDAQNVAIRSGHHCAQPTMDFFGVPATARMSFGVYTTHDDIDRAVKALQKAVELFS